MAEAIASPTSTPQWRTAYRRVVGGGSLLAKALAGPALIVGAVLILLHAFAFSGLITNQYEDLLPYWLPNYCFLGRSLASGTIPLINPTVLGGVPFAANPQTGWMNLPVMSLFSTLPCDAAMR